MNYKCYRCNLEFRDKQIAILHDEISDHKSREEVRR